MAATQQTHSTAALAAAERRTLATFADDIAREHKGTALRFPTDSGWSTQSFADLAETVRELAKGLVALGVEPGDRVGILGQTRAEWTWCDLAVLAAGGVGVPVYHTNSPEECQFVLEHSGAKIILCEDAEQVAKIERVRGELPQLQHVAGFAAGVGELSLDDLRARGKDVDEGVLAERAAAVEPDDLATIVYTSGTTGNPKGCMLTHRNVASGLEMVKQRLPAEPGSVFYAFLPLAHVLTRLVQFVALDNGSELAFWRRDPKKLLDDVATIRPTHLPSVPRIFEKIHTTATAKAEAAGGVKGALFKWAVGVGRASVQARARGSAPNPLLRAQHAVADKLVLSKVRALFGGRLELAVTGAAPIEPSILEFFEAAGVEVLEGYGMTETAGIATLNVPGEKMIGTVGRPMPGCEIKIEEGSGEVLMKGPNIFVGYYRNEEATKEDLVDGWLHSGDIGELDDGYLRITGRKKDLIITSSGKNIAPAPIEGALAQHRWISRAVIFGDRKPYVTALLTLDPDEAEALAEHVGEPGASLEQLAKSDKVRAEIQRLVDETNQRFARIYQVKKFDILERDLDQEHGEMTPTMKVKRAAVYEAHGDRFAALYDKG
jgi:long-chain acyl-CoA synthetase